MTLLEKDVDQALDYQRVVQKNTVRRRRPE
jgi:hypothetical protein